MAVAEEIMVARVKKDGKKTPRSATKQRKLACQFNPNTYRMKVRG
jgi:hypothetical protein